MNDNLMLLSVFLAPLAAAAVGLFCGKLGGHVARAATILASLWVAVGGGMLAYNTTATIHMSHPWVSFGDYAFNFGLLYTPLAAQMIWLVGVVGLAVTVFSVRYMRNDAAQSRYYAALAFFTFSMLGVVLADNLVCLFVFWELVGFSSYMLIGHYSTAAASAGAKKAFLVNKLGDVLFIAGIIWALLSYGNVDLTKPFVAAAGVNESWKMMVAVLLLGGVIAKSAQWPMHLWLPDAMVGPTPVSALIHAATMVAAGVYMLCRFDFLFVGVGTILTTVGAATALLGALWAFGQSDLKRVLAYSTVSQLGFMVVGVGLGCPAAAFFHLTTHAFFKSLLFLGAGSVIDGCHHLQEMPKMGGLWKKMPWTFAVFVIGTLSLAGFPMLAGFFSKDTILTLAYHHSTVLTVILATTSLLTALYMGRAIGLTFMGKARSEEAVHAREGGLWYLLPMGMLAVGAIVAGNLAWAPRFAAGAFAGLPQEGLTALMIGWGAFVCVMGAVVAVYYSRQAQEPLEGLLKEGYTDLREGFYFDKLWENFGAHILAPKAQFWAFVDEVLVCGVLTKGTTSVVSVLGLVARWTYKGLVTYVLYWVLLGALVWVVLFNR